MEDLVSEFPMENLEALGIDTSQNHDEDRWVKANTSLAGMLQTINTWFNTPGGLVQYQQYYPPSAVINSTIVNNDSILNKYLFGA